MNEPLRRALLHGRLRENDVAARLGVDPKTVRRWLNGRVPYPHNRSALADLVEADEADLYYSRCLSLCSWTVASGDVRTFN